MEALKLFQADTPEIRVLDNLDVTSMTLTDYRTRIKHFINFSNRIYTPDILLRYKRELENQVNLSVSTKNKYLAVAKAFIKQLNKAGITNADIEIKSFKDSRKHKKTGHNEEEIKKILEDIRLADERTKVIFALAIFQGMREIEISRILIEDINLKEKTALIQGKGKDGKELIFLQPYTVKVIEKYIKNKKSGRLINLSTRQIRNIYYRFAPCEKSMHGLRHYYTTKMIKILNGDLIEVSKYTRHSSLNMLQVYNDELSVQKTLPKIENEFKKLL